MAHHAKSRLPYSMKYSDLFLFNSCMRNFLNSFFNSFFNKKPSSKFTVSNNDADDLIVWIEPWAHDFTLEPGEDIQIICDSEKADMDIHRENGLMQIYLNSSSSFIVRQQGKTINCGHKRKPDLLRN